MSRETPKVPLLDFDRKYCFDCCYFLFSCPESSYSELTPRSNAVLECALGRWNLLNYCNIKTFGECMESAEECPEFLARKTVR